MNIDERLDRLTARHEALTQSLELLHHDVREQGKNIQEQGKNIAQLLDASRQDGEPIRALVRVAEIHERRHTDLEGGK